MMALHSVNVGVVSSSVDNLTGMQPQQQQSVCGPTTRRSRSCACTKAYWPTNVSCRADSGC